MTTFRRVAQVVEDLKTLNIVQAHHEILSMTPVDSNFNGITIHFTMDINEDYCRRSLVEEAFKQEFGEDVEIYSDGRDDLYFRIKF